MAARGKREHGPTPDKHQQQIWRQIQQPSSQTPVSFDSELPVVTTVLSSFLITGITARMAKFRLELKDRSKPIEGKQGSIFSLL